MTTEKTTFAWFLYATGIICILLALATSHITEWVVQFQFKSVFATGYNDLLRLFTIQIGVQHNEEDNKTNATGKDAQGIQEGLEDRTGIMQG